MSALGVKRTSEKGSRMSPNDPERKSGGQVAALRNRSATAETGLSTLDDDLRRNVKRPARGVYPR